MSGDFRTNNGKGPEVSRVAAIEEEGIPEALLERYLRELETGLNRSPEEFLGTEERGATPGQRQLWLESLRSLRIVFAAGFQLKSDSARLAGLPEPGSRLGDFQILRPLGRGGMGIVFLARQLSLDRTVALKILSSASLFDSSMRARFQIEARAAAALQHPHVVPVHAIGHDQGIDYYAMQYIAGRTLQEELQASAVAGTTTRVADPDQTTARDALAGTVRSAQATAAGFSQSRRMNERQAVTIAQQIADALAHAHRAGIIHRDVKPSNILLDETGKPWLADFGLAQRTHDQSLTGQGTILGSLRYMSPEQLEPDRAVIDHRTDVYSLGATLYEMLSGEPAIAGTDRTTVMRNVAEGRVRRLRGLRRELSRDVDTVVHKALQLEPVARYDNMAAFASDLQALLDNRPIQARPAGLAHHIGLWARRNQSLVQAGVATLILIVIGLSAALWMIDAARHRAELANQDAQAARKLAEQNLGEAIRVVSDYFRSSERALRELPGTLGLQMQLGNKARFVLRKISESNPGSTLSLKELAEASVTLAKLHVDAGDFASAAAVEKDSLEVIAKLRLAGDGPSADDYEAHLRFAMASALAKQNRLAEALTMADGCLELVNKTRNAGKAHTWQHHVYRWQRGVILTSLRRFDEAVQQLEEAVAEIEASLATDPDDPHLRVELAQAWLDLGRAQYRLIGHAAAEVSYRNGLAEIARLESVREVNWSKRWYAAELHLSLGQLLMEQMNDKEAESELEQAVQIAEKLVADDPESRDGSNLMGTAENSLGQVCLRNGRQDRAFLMLDRAAAGLLNRIDEDSATAVDPGLGGVISNLGVIEMQRGQPAAACGQFDRAIRLTTAAHNADQDNLELVIHLVNQHYNLHSANRKSGKNEASLAALQAAEQWQQRVLQGIPGHLDEKMKMVQILNQQAVLLGLLDRWNETGRVTEAGLSLAGEVVAAGHRTDEARRHRDFFLAVTAETAFRKDDLAAFRQHVEQRIAMVQEAPSEQWNKYRGFVRKDLETLRENDTDQGDQAGRTRAITELLERLEADGK